MIMLGSLNSIIWQTTQTDLYIIFVNYKVQFSAKYQQKQALEMKCKKNIIS